MTVDTTEKKDSGSSEMKSFDWVPSKTPIPEIFSNYIHTSWSLYDVRLLFGQLKPEYGNSSNFLVEEKGAINLPWGQVKKLSVLLTSLVAKYEEANGELKQPKLADKPE